MRLDSVAFDVVNGVGKIYVTIEETNNLSDPNGWNKVVGDHDGDHILEVPVDLNSEEKTKIVRLKFKKINF